MKRHPRAGARGTASVALLLAPCALPVGSWCASTPAAAQQAAASAEDEIVVTARRREETLSDVPVSASVIGGQAIAERNIQSLQDLTNTTPAVQLAQGTTSNRQIIRGIGSGDNPSFEQSVGTFVDDIYHGRSRVSASSIFDVDRVETLRGPQTTYFGNNTIAGALSLSTRDPGEEYAANLRAAFTPEFGGYVLEGGADLPLSDTLAIRVAAQVNGGDGWIDDRAAGRLPETDNMASRATVLWRPSEAFTARFKAQHVEDRQERAVFLSFAQAARNLPNLARPLDFARPPSAQALRLTQPTSNATRLPVSVRTSTATPIHCVSIGNWVATSRSRRAPVCALSL